MTVALSSYEGAVLLVSHDRHLLRASCDELWLVRDGKLSEFDGDLDEYAEIVLKDKKARNAAPEDSGAPVPVNRKEQRRNEAQERARISALSKPLKKELSKIEKELDLANKEKSALDLKLADTDFYQGNQDEVAEALKRHGELSSKIDKKLDDGRLYVKTSKGTEFLAKAVFIAAGVGSFQSRTLKVPHIEQFEGKQLHYRVKNPEIFEGKNIVICGGGDSALDWCLNLVGKAESVVLVHRREGFRAAPASVSKMKELCDNWEMQFEVGQVTGFTEENGQMTEVKVTGADGVTRRIPAEHLLVFFGLQPKLGPIADWGLTLERKQIVVDTARFETNIPGVFAVGDINIYPGKKKLILSGFHECALAAFAASEYVYPEKRCMWATSCVATVISS